MKTLLAVLSILVLTLAVISLDSHQLDLGDWFAAAAVAAMFGFAFNDSGSARRRFQRSV